MQRFVSSVMIGVCLLAGQQGCYKTVVRSGAQAAGPTHDDRQWFTLFGLVGLSDPAGQECGPEGLAYAESEMGGMDILINIGIALAGAAVGAAVCDSEDADGDTTTDALCVNSYATIAPLLLSTRTVRYACVAPSRPIQYMPDTQGTQGTLPAPPSPAPLAPVTPVPPVAPVPPAPATAPVAPPDGAPELAPVEAPAPGTDPGSSR